MISLIKLEVFAAVFQEGSFTQAARRLLMTQSAVSQHIMDLERALGTTLFTRGQHGATPTDSGERLYIYVSQILRLISEAEHDLTNVTALDEGQAVIGATPTLSMYLIPQWVRTFRMQYERLSVSLRTATTSEIVDQVLGHQLDIGFVEGEVTGSISSSLGMGTLGEIQMVIVVGHAHPIANRQTITIEELATIPFVMRPPNSKTRLWVDHLFQRHGLHPTISAEFDSPESIKQTLAMGTCATILPDYAVREDELQTRFRLLHLQDIPLLRTLKAVWNAQHAIKPIAAAFLEIARQEYKCCRYQDASATNRDHPAD